MVQHLILFKLDQNGSQGSFGAFNSKVLASSQFRCFSSKFRSELSDQELIRVKYNLLSIKIKTFTQKCQGKTVQVNLLKIDFHSKLQSVIMLSVSQSMLNSQYRVLSTLQRKICNFSGIFSEVLPIRWAITSLQIIRYVA